MAGEPIDPQFWLSLLTLIVVLASSVIGFVIRSLIVRIDKNETRIDTSTDKLHEKVDRLDKESRDRTAKAYVRIENVNQDLHRIGEKVSDQVLDVEKRIGDLGASVATKANSADIIQLHERIGK